MKWKLLLLLLPLSVIGEKYCIQFTTCETCAGRHHVTFEECVWCPISNSCVPPNVLCRSGFKERFDCPQHITQKCLSSLPGRIHLWKRFAIQRSSLFTRFSGEFFVNRQAQFEGTDGLVNRFTYDSWFKLWYVLGMKNTIQKLLDYYKNYELWVVGHAIGGAKAEMTALAAIMNNFTSSEKVKLITFGSTRLGDLSFVEMIETMVPYRFRIVHNRDMAVRFPKPYDGETTPPHHHRYEVWYPNNMSPRSQFRICLGAEDPQCSSRLSPWELNADDNDIYFQKNIANWAESGCEPEAPKLIKNVRVVKRLRQTTTIAPDSSEFADNFLDNDDLQSVEITTIATTTPSKSSAMPWDKTNAAASSISSLNITNSSVDGTTDHNNVIVGNVKRNVIIRKPLLQSNQTIDSSLNIVKELLVKSLPLKSTTTVRASIRRAPIKGKNWRKWRNLSRRKLDNRRKIIIMKPKKKWGQ